MTRHSRRISSRFSMLGSLLFGAVGLVPLASLAQSTPAVAPNVLFLLDNSRAMQEFPIYLSEATSDSSSPSMSSVVTDPQPGDPGYNDPKYGHFINTGCSDPALVAEMSWFDKNSPDPAKNGSIAQDADPDLRSPFFDPESFYHSRGRRVSWRGGDEDQPYSISDFSSTLGMPSARSACYQVTNYNTAYVNKPVTTECVKCLTSKGWWRGPITPPGGASGGYLGPRQQPTEPSLPPEARRKWVLSGAVLNVRPPRFVAARRALKDIVATTSHVRMGVATLGRDWPGFDPAWLQVPLQPESCVDSSPPFPEERFDRPRVMRSLNSIAFDNLERPTGEGLFSVGAYFSSVLDSRWNTWFAQPIGNGNWGWPGLPSGGTTDNPLPPYQSGQSFGLASNEWFKVNSHDSVSNRYLFGQRWESGGPYRSVCSNDQVNAVILVTGAEPRYDDNAVPITRMMDLLLQQGSRHPTGELLMFDPRNPLSNPNSGGINYCDRVGATQAFCDYTDYNWPTGVAKGNKNFMDDTAFFLSHMDLRGDLPGTQRLRTYVIGYGTSHAMLQSIALAGDGSFRRVDDAASLKAALEQTLAEIRAASP